MVDTLTWVLVGIAAYTAGAMFLKARGLLPESIRVSGPIVTIHTKRGRAFLDWLASPRRLWRAWGNFGVGIALVVMVGAFVAVFNSAIQTLAQPERTPVQNPQNALVIPGVNDFLPLAAAPEIVFGLLVGLVVHEGGHGLLCRVEDIDIDSMGLALFAFIPMGAFVEPDEESRIEASRGSQTRMFAAGVTNNFLVAFVGFLLLFGPVSGSIAVVDGAPIGDVADGSGADAAGLEYGDVITQVEGQPVANTTELQSRLDAVRGERVAVTLQNGSTVTVDRRPLITRAIPSVVDDIELSRENPPVIQSVNGTDVATERDLARAFAERTVVELETDRGNATFPVGTYAVSVNETGPLAAAGADEGPLIITHVDGERVVNDSALSAVTNDIEPGTTVPVVVYQDGERQEYEVTTAPDPDGQGSIVGVRVQSGYSGLVVDDFGTDAYPAGLFLGYLGGQSGPLGGLGTGTFLQLVFVSLALPFYSTIDPTTPYNFAGFLEPMTNFYTATGPLAALGDGGAFLLANVLFWTAWVNLNLGLFNCIPTFPLDGGHILRASAESLVARLPIDDGRRATTALTVSISLVMLAALVLMLFGPQLVG